MAARSWAAVVGGSTASAPTSGARCWRRLRRGGGRRDTSRRRPRHRAARPIPSGGARWRRSAPWPRATGGAEQQKYVDALQGLEQGDCKKALARLKAASGSGGSLSDNAMYWEAKCLAARGNQRKATSRLNEVVNRYPEERQGACRAVDAGGAAAAVRRLVGGARHAVEADQGLPRLHGGDASPRRSWPRAIRPCGACAVRPAVGRRRSTATRIGPSAPSAARCSTWPPGRTSATASPASRCRRRPTARPTTRRRLARGARVGGDPSRRPSSIRAPRSIPPPTSAPTS